MPPVLPAEFINYAVLLDWIQWRCATTRIYQKSISQSDLLISCDASIVLNHAVLHQSWLDTLTLCKDTWLCIKKNQSVGLLVSWSNVMLLFAELCSVKEDVSHSHHSHVSKIGQSICWSVDQMWCFYFAELCSVKEDVSHSHHSQSALAWLSISILPVSATGLAPADGTTRPSW